MGRVQFWSMVAILLLAASILMPATAAAAEAGTADHHIAIRQAHLAWMALKTELEMEAALTYAGTRYNTDTTRMASLLAELRSAKAQIPSAPNDASVDILIANIRQTTRQFRDETRVQMSAGQGNWNELERQIDLATSGNPYIEAKKSLYWSTRKAGQLSDFDAWAGEAQDELAVLNAKGYDTSRAQRALDVTLAKRPELQAALEARDEEWAGVAGNAVFALSTDFIARVGETGQQVPDDARIRFLLEQADRAVAKADRLNTDTTMAILEIGAADPALSSLKNDITSTRRLLIAGKIETAKKNLPVIKKDLTDLAEGYRAIARSADLPADLSGALNSMAVALDNTASRMGGD